MTQRKDSKHARNIKILMEEGYTRLNIQRALRLSHGKLDLGRRVLQLVKHEHGKVVYSSLFKVELLTCIPSLLSRLYT